MSKQNDKDKDRVAIDRGLLVALIRTTHALCRIKTDDRVAECRDLLAKIDMDVDWSMDGLVKQNKE